MLRESVLAAAALCILIQVSEQCSIKVKVRSQTKNAFQIQILVPAIKRKTERVTFKHEGEKKVHIQGENCMMKSWKFRTWRLNEDGDWVAAKETEAFLDGSGTIVVNVPDTLQPHLGGRFGVVVTGK
ncbi:putative immunogenic protein NIP-3 [Aphelenchoides avenae]|nr:putative immunogenic protein NIP-3 [Aphelenchus avenae]